VRRGTIAWSVAAAALLLGGCSSELADRTPPGKLASVDAVSAFFEAVRQGEVERASATIARFERVHPDAVRVRVERLAPEMQAGRHEVVVVSGKELGDVAVVVVNETRKGGRERFDIDPVYLIRQGDAWKILPLYTRYDRAFFDFTPDQMQGYYSLEGWFRAQEELLLAELTGGDRRPRASLGDYVRGVGAFAQLSSAFGVAAIAGAVCGLVPLALGLKRRQVALGVGFFVCSVLGGVLLGLFLAVPLAAIGTTVILVQKRRRRPRPRRAAARKDDDDDAITLTPVDSEP